MKLTRLDYLKATLAALEDDLTRPWSDYPCLEWPYAYSTHKNGRYGKIGIGNHTIDLVHRVSFQIAKGKLDPGKNACHHCDNTICFRPVHLFAGTQMENLHDAMRKGRMLFDWPRKRKFSDETIAELHRLIGSGLSHRSAAKQLNIGHTHANEILSGRRRRVQIVGI